jgi:DNA polymerase III alpha subunit (gram-positive type)
LTQAFPSWHPTAAVDTLRLARALKPKLLSYGLDKVGQALSLSQRAQLMTGQKHHSAPYDATLSALVLIELVGGLPEHLRASALRDADIFDQPQGSLL